MAVDPLDLDFDPPSQPAAKKDAPAPKPKSEPVRQQRAADEVFTHKGGSATRPSAARPQKSGVVDHYCSHPGCKLLGGFGLGSLDMGATIQWFCAEHAPPDFLPKNRGLQSSGSG